jgi:hypothetical protein
LALLSIDYQETAGFVIRFINILEKYNGMAIVGDFSKINVRSDSFRVGITIDIMRMIASKLLRNFQFRHSFVSKFKKTQFSRGGNEKETK